ncbi:glutamine synthetase 3 [Mycolicibacterium hassiacum DSM 44199]|uniref:Glutamine synthetase 3 n=1 Tax=Mycolicibacterium hassiacum (strain DSM 44199 / CIP 105218 / JCM 12690 / 3849) TaxID=1122247 RepID=K5BD42_MYCHD|nr:glutamine synthetase 3 [Mycolicibacterium hassiacum DSM 44199]
MSTDLATAPVKSTDLATLAQESNTRFILALFVDLRGKPCAKLVPVEAVDLLATEGVGFAGYAVGAMGQEPKDPDLMAMPDPASFTPIPFIKEGLAIVHCDPHVDGKPWAYAPRVILKALIQRAADAGYEPWVGAEVEYFLLRRTPDGGVCTADEADTAPQPCYDARGVTRMYDHLTAISTAMNTLGWSNYANDHEDANGQFEQNFEFADALTTADRVVTLRYLLSTIAAERGMIATFMPKPFADRTGSGLHLHLSLTSGGTPVFPAGDGGARRARARAVGDRLLVPRRHPRARLRAAGGGGANGQLLQADPRHQHRVGGVLVPQPAQLRRQRPHPLHPGPRRAAHRAARR